MLSVIRGLCCPVVLVMALALCALVGAGGFALAADIKVNLTGSEAVPALTTSPVTAARSRSGMTGPSVVT
jgi:hypothetical protein